METKETFTKSEIEKAVKDYERALRMASERGFHAVKFTAKQGEDDYGSWATFCYYQSDSEEFIYSDDCKTLLRFDMRTDKEIAKFIDETRDRALESWNEHVAKKNATKNLAEENAELRKEVEELRKRLNEQEGAQERNGGTYQGQ